MFPTALAREFRAWGDDRYSLAVPDLDVMIEVDRLRRERGELIGELSARCELSGARVVNGRNLSTADMNLSSARARAERAKLLASREHSQTSIGSDWLRISVSGCWMPIESDSWRLTFGSCRGRPVT